MTAPSGPDRPGESGSEPPAPPEDPPMLTQVGPRCELCGGPVLDRHCKVLCLNCGYQRDCSDP